MTTTPVQSSLIESIGHNGLRMRINFRSGKTYEYDRVPLAVYNGMLKAKSAGAYFGEHVKGKFKHSEIPAKG